MSCLLVAEHVQPLEGRRLLSLTPIGPEVPVPFPIEMSQFDMAVAGDGSFIVVADPIEQPGSPDVIAVRYAANGEQLGAPLRLDDRGFNVSVSMDADGDAVVAYQKGRDGVYVVRISRVGVASAPQRVGTAPAGQSIVETSVSMDDGGGYFVAWLPRAGDPQMEQIRAFDAAGQSRGPQFSLPGGTASHPHYHLDIAAQRDGSGAIVVVGSANESSDEMFFFRVSTTALLGFGSVNLGTAEPEAATYPDGSFIVGSTSASRSGAYGGVVQRFDAGGTPVNDSIEVGESLPGDPFNRNLRCLSVDTLPDGGFLAGYVQQLSGIATTYAQRFSASGVSIGSPVALDADPAKDHRIGTDANGDAVIAYLQTPVIGLDIGEVLSGEVHVRRLRAGFARLVGPELYVEGTDGDDHIIVERVRDRLWVNVNGVVEGFNAADVQFLSISGLGGDDDIDNNTSLPSTIHGGDGADTLWGGTGADRLRGFGGNDSLRGGDGDDVLIGDTGDDTLHGGDGVDTLIGAKGDDVLLFGEVHDRFPPGVSFSLRDFAVTIMGSDADDEITLSNSGVRTIVSVNGVTTAFPLIVTATILGGGGNDVIRTPILGRASLDGGAGDDHLSTRGADITLRGGDGNDTLSAGYSFTSVLDGGFGSDVISGGGERDARPIWSSTLMASATTANPVRTTCSRTSNTWSAGRAATSSPAAHSTKTSRGATATTRSLASAATTRSTAKRATTASTAVMGATTLKAAPVRTRSSAAARPMHCSAWAATTGCSPPATASATPSAAARASTARTQTRRTMS